MTSLSFGGKAYPPGARVFPKDFDKKSWRRLLEKGIIQKKKTQVTRFCMDPELIKDLNVSKLRIMVQNRGLVAPQTAEECIEIFI